MGVKWDFEKSVGVDLVASSRFPEAAERAHQGRDNRNSGPGLGGGLALPGWGSGEGFDPRV